LSPKGKKKERAAKPASGISTEGKRGPRPDFRPEKKVACPEERRKPRILQKKKGNKSLHRRRGGRYGPRKGNDCFPGKKKKSKPLSPTRLWGGKEEKGCYRKKGTDDYFLKKERVTETINNNNRRRGGRKGKDRTASTLEREKKSIVQGGGGESPVKKTKRRPASSIREGKRTSLACTEEKRQSAVLVEEGERKDV